MPACSSAGGPQGVPPLSQGAARQDSASHPDAAPPGALVGRLFVVATPIGTLGDFSSRAREVLAAVKLILAEDTRQTARLLAHFAIRTPMRAFHDHNEDQVTPTLIARLAAGDDLALVSDAGTPLMSDPGYRLVRSCRDAGIEVRCVPGPSAITAALSVAGVAPLPFTFAGFPPARAGARAAFLGRLAAFDHTLVLFLSPHRLAAELAACQAAFGANREAALLAELSKLYERCWRGPLGELAGRAAVEQARGEYTLVVAPPAPPVAHAVTPAEAGRALQAVLDRGLDLAAARRAAAQELKMSRRELYALLMSR
ncbi:MAG: 16S rRNA (cytidine(1402)-2'-O)-methyltransferase [Acidobacteria bacterium]|nr:16S rRNA (cytidine(1402)-2'-O)-methyltransferase [Acidobacteriota bacterium]